MDGRGEVLTRINQLLSQWTGEHHDPPPDDWQNWTVPQFLEATGAWLSSYKNVWTNRGEQPPTDGWVIFQYALRAAARYE